MVSNPVDFSLLNEGTWERASFTVPDSVPEYKVREKQDVYIRRGGQHLERLGFTIERVLEPMHARFEPVEEGRRKYVIHYWCKRRPEEIHFDIPDNAVAKMQGLGLKLQE